LLCRSEWTQSRPRVGLQVGIQAQLQNPPCFSCLLISDASRTGAEPLVNEYSGACHKSFADPSAGEAFIEARKQTIQRLEATNEEDMDDLVAKFGDTALDEE
jgi:hypothetical protein